MVLWRTLFLFLGCEKILRNVFGRLEGRMEALRRSGRCRPNTIHQSGGQHQTQTGLATARPRHYHRGKTLEFWKSAARAALGLLGDEVRKGPSARRNRNRSPLPRPSRPSYRSSQYATIRRSVDLGPWANSEYGVFMLIWLWPRLVPW